VGAWVVVVAELVVVGACVVVVVVVGAGLVVDGGVPVPVSDSVSVALDGAGLWFDGAGAVLTLGAGVVGALPVV
jgi:hypothetical protein